MMEFKHKAIIAAAIGCIGAVTLVACAERTAEEVAARPAREATAAFRPICVDGVQYWDSGENNARVVFPRFRNDRPEAYIMKC